MLLVATVRAPGYDRRVDNLLGRVVTKRHLASVSE